MEAGSIPLVNLQSHNAYFIEGNSSRILTHGPQIKDLFKKLKELQSSVDNKENKQKNAGCSAQVKTMMFEL